VPVPVVEPVETTILTIQSTTLSLLPVTFIEIMENFRLKEGEEYIELKNLIKILGWVGTGGEAKIRIDNQEIKVNGEIETQRRKKIRRGDTVVSGDNQVQVS
jgi:ribosome-associated protein